MSKVGKRLIEAAKDARRIARSDQKRTAHIANKPPSRKVKPMAKAPSRNTPKSEAPIIDRPEETTDDPEVARLRSVIEQVDVDIEAGQIVTAHARIKAALAHGQELEVEPTK